MKRDFDNPLLLSAPLPTKSKRGGRPTIDIALLQALHDLKLTPKDMARSLNATPLGIRKAHRRLKLEPHKRSSTKVSPPAIVAAYTVTNNDPELAEKLDVCRKTAWSYRHRLGLPAAAQRGQRPKTLRAPKLRNPAR